MGFFNKFVDGFGGGESKNEAVDPKEKVRAFIEWRKEHESRSAVDPIVEDRRLEENKRSSLREELGLGEEEFNALMQEVEAETDMADIA